MNILECNTLDELSLCYYLNKRKFSNGYNNPTAKNTKKHIQYILTLELVEKYNNKFGHLFFDIKNPEEKYKLCKVCKKNEVLFINDIYSKYCSGRCSSRCPDRIKGWNSKSSRTRRNKTMSNNLNDAVWRKSYCEKISKKSIIYNNLPENKKFRSELLKRKILSGEFTSNITNTWTHWSFEVLNKKFRSSFEGLFYFYQKTIQNNENLEYEKLRIKYFDGIKNRIYIVDFIDHKNKIVYEIKPESLENNENNQRKFESLIEWCELNDYQFQLINENTLKDYHKKFLELEISDNIVDFFTRKYKWNIL